MDNQLTALERVKNSTKRVSQVSKNVKINVGKIQQFVEHLIKQKNLQDQYIKLALTKQPVKFLKNEEPVSICPEFPSQESEINFICTLDILQMGSGYRYILHEFCDRGASDSVTTGVLNLQKKFSNITSNILKNIVKEDIYDNFLQTTKKPELEDFVEKLFNTICNSAQILINHGYNSFAEIIYELVDKKTREIDANQFIDKFTSLFPAFDDKWAYQNDQIFLYKKVQLLCGDIHKTFSTYKIAEQRIIIPNYLQITAFIDNVVPTVLRYFEIIEYNEELKEKINKASLIEPGSDFEIEIRACSLVAVELISQKAFEIKEKYNDSKNDQVPYLLGELYPINLSYYLWCMGKQKDIRKIERHYTQTIFY